LEEHTPALN